MPEFSDHDGILPLLPGDIYRVGQETGNHWRKIFNVYAKLLFELGGPRVSEFSRWQSYRDERMLQTDSGIALIFSGFESLKKLAPNPLTSKNRQGEVTLIMGKQFAEDIGFWEYEGRWVDQSFAVNSKGWILCPYFDYRQLSNARIGRLVSLINTSL